ncbi:MAG: ATP-dependent metallopeptidase FtsH/Yme1/Tma family protein, partial [Chloroflexota bacterium]
MLNPPPSNGRSPGDLQRPAMQAPRAGPSQPNRPWWQHLYWLLAIIILIWNVASIASANRGSVQIKVPYSVFLQQLNAKNVASVTFQGTGITGKL